MAIWLRNLYRGLCAVISTALLLLFLQHDPLFDTGYMYGKTLVNQTLNETSFQEEHFDNLNEGEKKQSEVSTNSTDNVVEEQASSNASEGEMKYILFWNEAYGSKRYGWRHGRKAFVEEGCPENRCIATDDRSARQLNSFDAIFFHQRSFTFKDVPDPNLRKNGQMYVHWMFEAPIHIHYDRTSLKNMDNFFNWTFTYRRDSTFHRPYGSVWQIKSHPTGSLLDDYITSFGAKNTHIATAKKPSDSQAPAAWFVSNCHSQSNREQLVKELSKYIGVDVYGDCGTLKCSRSNETNCYNMLDHQYRFYLSLENAICGDYITEKFFNVAKHTVIPVTLNGAQMDKVAPPHSYINVRDFKTVKDLADYLLMLTKNDEMYASYFWWKDFYSVNCGSSVQAFCDVCAALHGTKEEKLKKAPSNMYKWWVEEAQCFKPNFN